MAKRRTEKDEKAEEGFSPTKFDEENFLKKEKEKIKATFISFLFAVIIAFISFSFWILLQDSPFRWMLVFLFGIFTAAWLRYFFNRFNIAIEDLERRGMFTTYAIYFLTWLFVLIVLVNPPFYDDEPPQISLTVLPSMQEPGGTVKIVALVADNADIKDNQVEFVLTHNQSTLVDTTINLEEKIFQYEFENQENYTGDFSFTLQAEDTSGYTRQESGTFQYSTDVIKIPEPYDATTPPGPVVTYTTDIKIDIKPEVSWVYYVVDGQETNVTKEADDQFYTTSPMYVGWDRNSQQTIRVYAKTYHYFENIPIAFNNTVVDTTPYYFNVSGAAEIGTEPSPEVSLPSPRFIQVPGFETVLFLISLIGVVLIFIYKKKHGPNQS